MQSSLTDFFASPRASLRPAVLNALGSKSTPRRRQRSKGVNKAASNKPRFSQMIIDAGQKKIGLEHCIKCGMVYSLDEPKDVEQHVQFHNRFTETKNFRVTLNQIEAWKKMLYCEDVSSPINGSLFLITFTSTSTLKRKLATVLANFVNDELGYSSELPIWDHKENRKALVFITDANVSDAPFISGIALVDFIKEVIVMPQQKRFKGNFLGIDRIWVHSRLRRKGLATFLLDSARRILAPEMIKEEVPRTRVAFSDPSELGIKLAVNYVGDKENGRYIMYAAEEVKDKMDLLAKKLGV